MSSKLDLNTRWTLERLDYEAIHTRNCYHCWHSTSSKRIEGTTHYAKWRCDLCGAVAERTLLDYYAEGRWFGRDAKTTLSVG